MPTIHNQQSLKSEAISDPILPPSLLAVFVAKPDKNQPTIGTLDNDVTSPVPVATDVPINCPVDSPFAFSFIQAICFAVNLSLLLVLTILSPAIF